MKNQCVLLYNEKLSGTCRTQGWGEESVQNFSRKAWRKETTCETQA